MALDAAGYLGSGTKAEDGRWLTATAIAGRAWSAGEFSTRVELEGIGLKYVEPFNYQLGVGTLRLTLERAAGKMDFGVSADLSRGGYQTSYTLTDVLGRELEVDTSGSLGLNTLSLSATRNFPAAALSAVVRFPRTNGITYFQPTLAFARMDNGWEWTAHGTVLGTTSDLFNGGGGLRVARSLNARLRVTAEFEHQVRDLLLGTAPNSGGSLMLSYKLADPVANAATKARLVTVGERSPAGTSVQFQLEHNAAKSVALVGSFSDWAPQAMTRQGKVWRAVVRLPPGSHQFAFLVDGEWFLPANAPGVVDDGFGQKNATVVIERM